MHRYNRFLDEYMIVLPRKDEAKQSAGNLNSHEEDHESIDKCSK